MVYCDRCDTPQSKAKAVERRILQSNPILEAFGEDCSLCMSKLQLALDFPCFAGNASTLKNCNSSRFGKYLELHFDRHAFNPTDFHTFRLHVRTRVLIVVRTLFLFSTDSSTWWGLQFGASCWRKRASLTKRAESLTSTCFTRCERFTQLLRKQG